LKTASSEQRPAYRQTSILDSGLLGFSSPVSCLLSTVSCILVFPFSFSHLFTLPAAAGIGFELALFFPRPRPDKSAYYLIIKELKPSLHILKLALF
jgi:hypothetical protein